MSWETSYLEANADRARLARRVVLLEGTLRLVIGAIEHSHPLVVASLRQTLEGPEAGQ